MFDRQTILWFPLLCHLCFIQAQECWTGRTSFNKTHLTFLASENTEAQENVRETKICFKQQRRKEYCSMGYLRPSLQVVSLSLPSVLSTADCGGRVGSYCLRCNRCCFQLAFKITRQNRICVPLLENRQTPAQ